jgi:hypothetical protein
MSKKVDHIVHELPSVDVAFDLEAFNELIRSQGVKLVHYRAMRCPVGMSDLDDNRRPHPHHEGCSNGFIYTKVGCVTGAITSNNKKKSLEDVGFVDFSTVQCTLPQTYDNSDINLVIAPFDRFYLDEETTAVVMWQLFRHHETGVDRLKYPVHCVEGDIIDFRGEQYKENSDFVVSNGQIKWVGRRPGPEIDTGPGMGNGFGTDKGPVCSIRYLYKPYWYVGAIPHELRIAQVQDGFDRRAVRAPQMCVLHREYVSQNVEQASQTTGSEELRKIMAPMYSGFSPK